MNRLVTSCNSQQLLAPQARTKHRRAPHSPHMLNVSDFSRPSARDNAGGMSATSELSQRLSAFRSKFSDFVSKHAGRSHTGYDQLNQGLLAGEATDDSRQYGGGGGGYSGPVPGYESQPVASEAAGGSRNVQGHVPSQVRMMRSPS